MELDDNFKRLVKELGQAINDSLADSERISDVMGRIRAAGYDLLLVLEVTIGFNQRGEKSQVHRGKLDSDSAVAEGLHLNADDAQFLRALKITIEE